MPDDNDIRPIESDEVYTHDLVTAQQQERARTAASEYRGTTNPSNFEPAPAAPSPDPEPSPEDEDISPRQSEKVSYYDALVIAHRVTTDDEVYRFGSELSDYADYYNAHIKQPGESDYQMPVSQVQPLDVVDDGAERPNESNLVGDYDVAQGGYSGIAVGAISRSGSEGARYSSELQAAVQKLDALLSGDGSISKRFEALKNQYDSQYTSNRSGVTDRSKMSVTEAGNSDTDTLSTGISNFKTNILGASDSQSNQTVNGFKNRMTSRIGQMPANVRSKLKDISQFQ
jgi:hypothetical protein